MKRLLLLALPGALWSAPQPPSFRLPVDAVPARYQLEMTLDPAKADFSGIVTIELKVHKSTPVVWLNATNLAIARASVEQNSAKQSARILPGGDDFAGFELQKPLIAGDARLTIEFSGKVNTGTAAGVFLSKRNDDHYLFTQFEPIDARKAFPCFDEPNYKTPWHLTLHVPAGQIAVSNTPVEREETEGGAGKKITFRETPPLPSYLVAYAVGPFEFVDGGVACRKKVPVRIVVPRGDAPRAKYAAEVTGEILTKLEDYFDIPYPFEKADQVSVPLSFGGAMENPGLVTYDAGIILAPPQGEDTPQRQRGYASIAAHELAHQWFGDLVTMAWWNDTWLNESFATFMSQKLLATWKPEWQTRVDDQVSRTNIMGLDQLASVRQINQPVNQKPDIASAFDGITYEKGGAVLTMFDHSLGAERFRAAVRLYLTQHANGNGTAENFLDAMREMGGPQVAASFRTFLNQPGVPEIRMKLECGGGEPRIEMEQERFRPLGSTAPASQVWQVPVCVAYENGSGRATKCGSLNEKTGRIALPAKSCPAWFLGNAAGAGYYYTTYGGDALEKLVANRTDLSLPERVGVLGEVNSLEQAGKLLPSKALRLAAQLKDDPKRQIVSSAVQLAQIRVDFLPQNLRPKYVRYVEENFGPRARKLGWIPKEGESEDDRLMRPDLVEFVARQGEDPELIASARELTNRWLDTRASLPADTISGIFRTSARYGDAALHERMVNAAEKEKDEFFLGALLDGIGAFRHKDLVEQNLWMLASGKFDARLAMVPFLMSPVRDAPDLERVPMEFVKQNYADLAAKLPSAAGSDYAGFLPFVGQRGCSAADADDLQAFFGPRLAKVNGGPHNLAEAVEMVRLCEATKNVRQPDLVRFFQGL